MSYAVASLGYVLYSRAVLIRIYFFVRADSIGIMIATCALSVHMPGCFEPNLPTD